MEGGEVGPVMTVKTLFSGPTFNFPKPLKVVDFFKKNT